MNFPPFPLALLLSASLIVAGCAAKGPFPSLAPRPAERLSMDEPVRPTVATPADSGLAARITELLAEARSGQSAFDAALPAARADVGAAGGSGSEAWIGAQEAISRLEAARAKTVAALAELDKIGVERAGKPTSADQLRLLSDALESAEALAHGQQTEIDRLKASLSPA